MKLKISFILATLWVVVATASEQALSLIASSTFEMRLLPTLEELDAYAATQVESAIMKTLLTSASSTSKFESIYDVDIVLQQIEWVPDNDQQEMSLTIVRFEVYMTFFLTKSSPSPPSKFALDSLIARTFSQPSSKSSFLNEFDSPDEPILVGAEDIEIQIVEDPEGNNGLKANVGRSLSVLDVILIVASTCIFLAILYIIHQHNQDTFGLAEYERRNLRQSGRRRKPSSRNPGGDTNEHSESPDRDESHRRGNFSDNEDTNNAPLRNVMVTTHSLNEPESPRRSIIDKAANQKGVYDTGTAAAGSPPVSLCSSMPSSPATSHRSNTPPPCLSVTSSPESRWLLGAPQPNYPALNGSSSPTSDSSPLTARLLLLPMLNAAELNTAPFRSSVSAPAVLMNSRLGPSSKYSTIDERSFTSARSLSSIPESTASAPAVMVNIDDRSVKSARSLSSMPESDLSSLISSESEAGVTILIDDMSFKSVRSLPLIRESSQSLLRSSVSAPGIMISSKGSPARSLYSIPESCEQSFDTSISHSSSGTVDLSLTSAEPSMVIAGDNQFDNNWLESKRRAIEDEEDDIEKDVFQIDIENHSSKEDNRSRMSGFSAVSEWLKSVRVIESPTDSRTSDMSISSAEHSSVEPKSTQARESNSVDCSLERSLATSLVEV